MIYVSTRLVRELHLFPLGLLVASETCANVVQISKSCRLSLLARDSDRLLRLYSRKSSSSREIHLASIVRRVH